LLVIELNFPPVRGWCWGGAGAGLAVTICWDRGLPAAEVGDENRRLVMAVLAVTLLAQSITISG